MKLSRDTWLGIGILLTLVLVTSLAAFQQSDDDVLPYLSTSPAPDGTLALSLWLEELGYQTADAFALSFNPNAEIDIIFITQPIFEITANEWRVLDQWIEQGGTLILAGTNGASNQALMHFDFRLAYLQEQTNEISPALPILKSPVLESKINFATDFGIFTARTDYTPLITAQGRPLILTFQQGEGRVILSALPRIFTNLELKNETIPALVLNILAFAGQERGTVLFDEWHRGFQSSNEVIGVSQWLRRTPGGHAILFVVFTLFIALILQGRQFGRHIPLAHEIKRRGPMEHVTAVANLSRKAGHRKEVARQYHQRLKRHLGQRYHLDPSMADEEYVNSLVAYNPSIDREKLLQVLKHLSQTNISEAELLKLSAEASRWINE